MRQNNINKIHCYGNKSLLKFIILITFYSFFSSHTFEQNVATIASLNDTIILNSFKQGKTLNNCASIALIKASIGTFGLRNIIHKIGQEDSNFVFLLRNGEKIFVSDSELRFCNSLNGFVLKNTDSLSLLLKNVADTCFAIMCKKQQLLEGCTLTTAVARLNTGYKTSTIASLLGVKFNVIRYPAIKKISAQHHIIICNYFHASYATNGMYDDPLDEAGYQDIRQFKWNKWGLENVFSSYSLEIQEAYSVIDF